MIGKRGKLSSPQQVSFFRTSRAGKFPSIMAADDGVVFGPSRRRAHHQYSFSCWAPKYLLVHNNPSREVIVHLQLLEKKKGKKAFPVRRATIKRA